jgi:hypothetical protein
VQLLGCLQQLGHYSLILADAGVEQQGLVQLGIVQAVHYCLLLLIQRGAGPMVLMLWLDWVT